MGNAHTDSTPKLADLLIECQSIFRDIVLGLLDVSFPVDESITNNDFKDTDAASAAMRRMKVAADLTATLGKFFVATGVDPKPTSRSNGATEDPLAPEVLK